MKVQKRSDTKQEGNVGDIVSALICVLAMTVVMTAYFRCAGLIRQKAQIGQVARQYILRMESAGYLVSTDRERLEKDLEDLGASDISLDGTTLDSVGYGQTIRLEIRGRLKGDYEFVEKRVSTAKY